MPTFPSGVMPGADTYFTLPSGTPVDDRKKQEKLVQAGFSCSGLGALYDLASV